MALAGVAHADRGTALTDGARNQAKPTLQDNFDAKRNAAIGAPNSRLRKELENDIRQKLREGRVDPRRVTLADVIDEVIVGDGMSLKTPHKYGSPYDAARNTRAGIPGNPNPWASTLAATDFLESFETYTTHTALDPPTDWFELAGQTAPNGNVWQASADYNGVVDNALAQTGANWDPAGIGENRHGVAGGPDPSGDRSLFAASPRGSISTQPELSGGFFQFRLNHALYAPTAGNPVTIIQDFYLDDIDTFVWWRPVDFVSGFIVTNVFLGGYDFQYFAPFVNASNIADRLIILGPKPGSFDEGEFFGAQDPHKIQTQEWFQCAIRMGATTFSVWVRDSTTTGYGFEDTDGVIDTDGIDWDLNFAPGEGPFEGEILQSGWLQFFPGVEDDVDTVSIEGNGTAFNLFNQEATVQSLTEGPLGPRLFANGVNGLQQIGGSDPSQTTIPGFQPNDYYIDNYTVIGPLYALPDPVPDFKIPFLDDIELWTPGPLGLQNDQWFDNASTVITDFISASGDQSVQQISAFSDNVFREQFTRDVPVAVADTSTPVVFTINARIPNGPSVTRGIFLDDNTQANDFVARLILGGQDGNFISDNIVYVRLPNPDFDPNLPSPDVTGLNQTHTPGANTAFLNVPLRAAGGGAPTTVPIGASFFPISISVIDDGTGAGDVSISINGTATELDTTGLGLVNPIALETPSLGFDQVESWSGNELNGLLSEWYLDDYAITGPKELIPTPLTVPNAPYTGHPAFSLPYSDGFEDYSDQRSLGGQGATPWLGGLFTDTNAQLDIIPTVDPVTTSTSGYYYTIDNVLLGTVPGGAVASDTVFVVDNIAPTLPPNPAPVPGSTSSATRAKFRDASEVLLSEADWTLNSTTPSNWDGTTTVVGRYYFTYSVRWGSTVGEELLITDGTNVPANGKLVSLINSFASADANLGDLDGIFTSLLPEARPGPGETAELAFDLYISVDDPLVGPRSRLAWSIFGPGAQAGEIATVVFGGPNNFLDENTFDSGTGAISPGADGLPDNYFRGYAESLGGAPTYSDTTVMYVRVPNPLAGFGNPEFVLNQTAYAIPGNTWIRCTAEIDQNGDYTLTFDDGGTPFVLTGYALQAGQGDVQGTDGLFLQAGFDDGGDGLSASSPITFNTLGASAAPEGGTSPLSPGAGDNPNGSYNDTTNPDYFYFEIFEIWGGSTGLPTVQEVDPVSGALLATRDMIQGDIVALWNDQSTTEFGGTAGLVFSETIARNGEWQISADGGATITARGDWTPLGLPGDTGINDPAPNGGLQALAPPYNSFPFQNVFMGSIVDFPAAPAPVPAAGWFVDNVFMDIAGCFGDLNGSGGIDGADLGLLLGNWGQPGATDLNGSGATDGADLGLLLGAWGPCP
ncbi:MAG: hypothetical protein ACF8QF_07330 [Phycisphaerales bacterium]